MKKNKLMLFSVVTLLSFSAMGTVNNINNMTAQAKATKVIKKHHKKHLSKHEKLLQEVRKSINDKPNKNIQNNTHTNHIENGFDYTNNQITDFTVYNQTVTKLMLNLINNYREQYQIRPLTIDTQLSLIANKRAKQNNQWWNESWFDGHDDSNGNFIAEQLVHQAGLNYNVGENAAGTPGDGELDNPEDAANEQFQKWVNEGPNGGHYQNMMNPQYTKIGIGVYMNPDKNASIPGGYDEIYSN